MFWSFKTTNKINLIELTKNSIGPNSKYWKENKNFLKYSFSLRMFQYAAGKIFDNTIYSNTNILPKDEEKRKIITDKIRGVNRSSTKAIQFQRLLIGNNGLFEPLTPFKCNLSSKAANKLKRKKKTGTTNDHIIGVTSTGQYCINAFKNDFLKISTEPEWADTDIIHVQKCLEKMSDEWLKNHLWLWATCRITHEEHSPERLPRGTDISVEKKINLEHYNKANILIEEYK